MKGKDKNENEKKGRLFCLVGIRKNVIEMNVFYQKYM